MITYLEGFDIGWKNLHFYKKVRSIVPRRRQAEEMKFFLSGTIPVTDKSCTFNIMHYYQ